MNAWDADPLYVEETTTTETTTTETVSILPADWSWGTAAFWWTFAIGIGVIGALAWLAYR